MTERNQCYLLRSRSFKTGSSWKWGHFVYAEIATYNLRGAELRKKTIKTNAAPGEEVTLLPNRTIKNQPYSSLLNFIEVIMNTNLLINETCDFVHSFLEK